MSKIFSTIAVTLVILAATPVLARQASPAAASAPATHGNAWTPRH